MSRNYATMKCALWDNDQYLGLPSAEAQLLFHLLVQQRDISACGRLSIAPGRWAAKITGATRKTISDALDALHEAELIVVDWEHDELIVTKFVTHDANGNPNRIKAAMRSLVEITSETLLNAVIEANPDLSRCHPKRHPDGIPDPIRDAIPDGIETAPPISASRKPQAASHVPHPTSQQAAAAVSDGPPVENLPAAAAAAIRILIEHKIVDGEARKPRAFRRIMPGRLADEHGEALAGYLEQHPEADPVELATRVLELGEADALLAAKAIA